MSLLLTLTFVSDWLAFTSKPALTVVFCVCYNHVATSAWPTLLPEPMAARCLAYPVVRHTDWGSVTTEDATQNAALAAILFLAGGVGKDSPHFIITLVGSDPTVRPTALEPKQASSMLNQRLQLVQQQKVCYLHAMLWTKHTLYLHPYPLSSVMLCNSIVLS